LAVSFLVSGYFWESFLWVISKREICGDWVNYCEEKRDERGRRKEKNGFFGVEARKAIAAI